MGIISNNAGSGLYMNNQGYVVAGGAQTSNNAYIGGTPLTMSSAGYMQISIPSTHGYGAQLIRECFPKEWNITSLATSSNNYGQTSIELSIKGVYEYEAVNTFWQSRLYSTHSSWSPEGGQVTTFVYNIQMGDDLNALHKEVFEEEFIKDFEEVDK